MAYGNVKVTNLYEKDGRKFNIINHASTSSRVYIIFFCVLCVFPRTDMDKLFAIFSTNQSYNRKRPRDAIPAYDLPLLHGNRRIVIPPKPPHMSGKSIAPECAGVSKKHPPSNNPPSKNDENCDMSNILFGEPIPGIKQPLVSASNPPNSARYPTMALFK